MRSSLKCSMKRNSCKYSSSRLSSPKEFSITALFRQLPLSAHALLDALLAEQPLILPVLVYHSLEEFLLMMNMTDVAAALGISRAGAYKLAHSADFPAFQIGKRIVVSREKFLDWLDRQCEEQKCA